MIASLSELKIGDKAQILELGQSIAGFRQRLLVRGFVPGATLSIASIAPLGDPVVVSLAGDLRIVLRKDEGALIRVKKL